MFDISKITGSPYIPYVFIGIIALIYLICIIKFAKRGFIKDLFSLILLCLLIFACVKYGSFISEKFMSFGFLPEKILNFSNNQVASVLAYVLLIIVWVIVKKIIHACFKKLYKVDRKAMKFFGLLLGIPFALVLSIAFSAVCSPFLLHGSEKFYNNEYVQKYDEIIVEPIQDELFKIGVPASIEAIVSLRAPEEERSDYYAAFKNVNSFIVSPENYTESALGGSENVYQFIQDLTKVNNAISQVGNGKISANYILYIVDFANSGATLSCGEHYSNLYSSFDNLNVSAEQLTVLQTSFIE